MNQNENNKRTEIPRRDFLKVVGVGALGWLSTRIPVMAGPFTAEEVGWIIPRDKKLDPAWVKSLFERGVPETYMGEDLRFIGMPVGGICCGTVYLGGDGKLWLWDIFNQEQEGILPKTVNYRGSQVRSRDGSAYVEPPEQFGEVAQGFTLEVNGQKHELDRHGFRSVTFTGQYPIGNVRYEDPQIPVAVTLDAYSPFIPLNAEDSGLPATIMQFTVKNTGNKKLDIALTGRLAKDDMQGRIVRGDGFAFLELASRKTTENPQSEIVFEDWNKENYDGWRVEGTAFGSGPIKKSAIPAHQGDVGGNTERVVNSHATAPGNDVAAKDDATGKLTSRAFKIERDFINFWIGGGNQAGKACVNLLVAGKVVRSATGKGRNRMEQQQFDVRKWKGQEAVIEIVDAQTSGWGNIGVGKITFNDRPARAGKPEEAPDFGTMGLALLGEGDAVTRKLSLAPGESASVNYVVTWFFPNYRKGGRYYAVRFDSALAVAQYVVTNFARLSSETKLWRDTWYDSTLPYWFLDRTFANTSILATTTCYRRKNGRFWAWEGVGCCPGTCTHVWHYAQAVGRIFPEIERDQRERVDFGLALAADGKIGFRAEDGWGYAVDGQAGRILGAYREHQMSADDAFLRRVWPGVKKALQKIMATDGDGDGLIFGPLHNTLDADWHGLVPWLAGLYHAALRAGEAMAAEMGDTAFAEQCRAIFTKGRKNLDARCWREEYGYYVQEPDTKAPKSIGVYDGCHIDQVLGQSWARQVALGDVMEPSHVKRALKSLWDYNFTPDVGPFRDVNKRGRWYAMAGDGGLIMVSYPFTPTDKIIGRNYSSFMYFNECMSGFEHQVASHMVWDGLVMEGLAVTRAIHDRYNARLRNPYNEIECSDHYARAMASYGTFIAACGFEYHGPKGHIGFAPRLTPENFKAPFTSAEGWGTFSQDAERAKIVLKHGKLNVKTIALATTKQPKQVSLNGQRVAMTTHSDKGRLLITLSSPVTVQAEQELEIKFS
jgi:uncharacterized protein (DUF608 family)